MLNTILKGLKVLITGKQLVDSFSRNKPVIVPKGVPNPIPNLQHPAAVCDKARKIQDRTKLTPEQIEYIKSEYRKMREANIDLSWDNQKTTFELTKELNIALGLNKSRTSYSAVWHSKPAQESEVND